MSHHEPITVEIEDDHGKPHRYQIGYYEAEKSLRLLTKLTAIATPLLRSMGGVVKGILNAEAIDDLEGKQNAQAAAWGELLRSMDAGTVDTAINAIVQGIVREGNAALFREILGAVLVRTSDPHSGASVNLVPSDARQFNLAYTANLGELTVAMFHCLRHNFAHSFRRLAAGNGFSAR